MNMPVEMIWALIIVGLACLAGTIAAELITRKQREDLRRELEPNRQLLLLTEAPRQIQAPEKEQRLLTAPKSEAQ